MTFLTCLDEAYLKEGNVRMWLSLVFLCPRDKESGGGGGGGGGGVAGGY